jgi:hypothetical protein
MVVYFHGLLCMVHDLGHFLRPSNPARITTERLSVGGGCWNLQSAIYPVTTNSLLG